MKSLALEVRDEGTFIPVLAVDMNPSNDSQRWLLRRCGYPCDERPNIVLTKLDGNGWASNDPYAWGDRTFTAAHHWIIKHWHTLTDGAVVDVEFILCETAMPKQSERHASKS